MRKAALFLVIFSLVFAGTVTAETLDEAVLRSGCVIGEIDIPNSLSPGETYTITWMVQSYVDIRSRFEIKYSDDTVERLEGNLYDTKTGRYRISDRQSHEYYFSIQYTVPYGKGGDARVGFHNSQSDGNWWMYSLFPTGVIDRPYGTAGKQFYVSILNAEAPTGWASVSYLAVSPSSVNFDENFQISFTLKEVNGAAKSFENVAIAILDPYDGLVFDWAMFSNVTIPANGTFSKTVTNSIYARNDRPNGTYKAVIRGKVDGQWFDFDTTGNGVNPMTFTVGGGDSDFPETVIQKWYSDSKYASSDNAFKGNSKGDLKGQCTWYAYGRVIELVDGGYLPDYVGDNMYNAFWGVYGRDAKNWPVFLGGNWYSTVSVPLPMDKRKKGLLAVWDAEPHGHVGFVEEVSADKTKYRLSDFNRGGNYTYRNEWYNFVGISDRLLNTYPKFYDLSNPNW